MTIQGKLHFQSQQVCLENHFICTLSLAYWQFSASSSTEHWAHINKKRRMEIWPFQSSKQGPTIPQGPAKIKQKSLKRHTDLFESCLKDLHSLKSCHCHRQNPNFQNSCFALSPSSGIFLQEKERGNEKFRPDFGAQSPVADLLTRPRLDKHPNVLVV